jgi:hypothetical protein
MNLLHALSCCLRARGSSVGIVILQYNPKKCTFPKLIFYQLYQLPRPQYLTHSSTYWTALTMQYNVPYHNCIYNRLPEEETSGSKLVEVIIN